MLRDAALLGTRLVLGAYLTVHGAQKLFGSFGGAGLDRTSAGFHRIGLRPGRHMALAAGITELGGGVLTAAGVADPAGPLAIMGAMSVAAATHRAKGPLAARGGFELPLTNLAAAAALAVTGPGRFRLGPALPRRLAAVAAAGGAVAAIGLVARMVTARPVPAEPAVPAEGAGTEPATAPGPQASPPAAQNQSS
ncbi:MAG TPA: DoxX family protein [Streptosporangiaceae bacterium]|nr:DoxX family protein [Streptosporangiaceae bacterium]